MKTKTSKRLFALLLSCVMALSALTATVVFAATDEVPVENSNTRASTYALNTDTAIKEPSVTHDNTRYNMVVIYEWVAGTGGDNVALSSSYQYFTSMGSAMYREYEFPNATGTNHCDPDYYLGKSYYSITNKYSYNTKSLEHTVGGNVRYGYDARYSAVGMFDYLKVNVGTEVPTSYDQANFIWTHNAYTGEIIKGTIEYNGEIVDIEVEVPWVGYKTTDVVVGGYRFYLRTGPSRCSIKVGQSGVDAARLNFAFGIA